MIKEISYNELLKIKNYILIDLRTPEEFNHSTIPKAVNVPIFSDDERKEIGYIYKNISIDSAKILGMDLIGPKLSYFYKIFKQLSEGRQIVLFCAKGGLRSRVISYSLSALGLPIIKLDKGYKGYRAHVISETPKILNKIEFVTLFGKTGTGKTNILQELKKLGADILDLEGYANHRGSLFGSVGLQKPNSQKQFENLVYNNLLNRNSNIIFTEGESKRIGNIIMPNDLYNKTREGKNVLINASLDYRIQNIKNEYLKNGFDENELFIALDKLQKYISQKDIKYLKNCISNKEYDFVIERLMTDYYDKNYKSRNKVFEYNYENTNDAETADKLIKNFC